MKKLETKDMVAKLSETGICIRVKVHGWGGTVSDTEWKRKLADSLGLSDNANMFGIFGKALPDGIKRQLNAKAKTIKDIVELNTVPFLDGDWRLAPIRIYPKLRDAIMAAVAELRTTVEGINREDIVQYCKALYGPNYKERFVPRADELKSKFQVSFKTMRIGIPTAEPEGLNPKDAEALRKEVEEQFANAYSGAFKTIIESIGALLERLDLSTKEDVKRLSVSRTISTFRDALKDLHRFNLTRNPEVLKLIEKLDELIVEGIGKTTDKDEARKNISAARKLLDDVSL